MRRKAAERSRLWTALVATLLVSPAVPGQAAAPVGPSAAPRAWGVEGTYQYVGGAAEIAALDRAIEGVVGPMNFLVRSIARSRLRKPNLPTPELRIVVSGGMVTVARPGRASATTPSDGRRLPWVSPEGDRFVLSQRLEAGRLTQRFETGGGISQNIYTLSADGQRLRIDTIIAHRRLPSELRFHTTYRRR